MSQTKIFYRPDIDGLRAIAVLSVIVFHYFPQILPGGFVGVDIFFVISGYLIGTLLLREHQAGTFSVIQFYCRRAVRILPAFIAIMGVTWLLGWALFFKDEYQSMGKDLVTGATFISNLRAWGGAGYFALDAESQPLLHLWSLGIEEQFYLIVPLCFAFLGKTSRAVFKWSLGLFGVSFAICIYASAKHPSAAFYFPITRAWELFAGVILSLLIEEHKRDKLPHKLTPLLRSMFGVLLILAALALIKPIPGYPGAWALLPVVGTMALIGAGNEAWFNKYILSLPALRKIGLISYPLYLWHWPILVFWKTATQTDPTTQEKLKLFTISFVMAWFTVFFLERPIRTSVRPLRTRACWLTIGTFIILILGIFSSQGLPPERLSNSSDFIRAQIAVKDWEYAFPDNFGRVSDFKVDGTNANIESQEIVLFAGDSHMQQYWPRIKLASQSDAKPILKYRLITSGGSPMLPGVNRTDQGYRCDLFFDFIMEEALKKDVKRVVFCCFWEHYFNSSCPIDSVSDIYEVTDPMKSILTVGSLDNVLLDFEESIRHLKTLNKDVVVILPTPAFDGWNPRKIKRWSLGFPLSVSPTSLNRIDLEKILDPLMVKLIAAVTRGGGRLIYPYDFFVEDGQFHGRTSDGQYRFRDSHHPRPFYIVERATFIDELFNSNKY